MITKAQLQAVVSRANLAPSVHNVQPARWRMRGDAIEIAADLSVHLAEGDPTGHDAGLSCGAAVDATVLSLGDHGLGAEVHDLWVQDDRSTWPGHRMAARLSLMKGASDPLVAALEERFTWRERFEAEPVPAWDNDGVVFVSDEEDKAWIAERNDFASLNIMQRAAFRKELLSWMRLSEGHPRHAFDGLSRDAMQMSKPDARLARWALGVLWPTLNLFGATKGMTVEAEKTQSAPLIAVFCAPSDESPVVTGRAYLRLCLKAAQRGLAMWPMAALSDHPQTNRDLRSRFDIAPTERIVQVIRFGKATGQRPERARRPLEEILT